MPGSHLTRTNRLVIEKCLSEGLNQAAIARKIGCHESTISRERKRNPGPHYRAFHAQARYVERRKLCKADKFAHAPLLEYVLNGLAQRWSPEQIAGRLRIDFPNDSKMRISFESIYAFVFRKFPNFVQYFRIKSKYKKRTRGLQNKRKLVAWGRRRDIEERSKNALNRREFGHIEGDTVEGRKGTGYLVTYVDRKSRKLRMRHLKTKTAESVLKRTEEIYKGVMRKICRTITSDRGSEFSRHEEIEKVLGIKFYFAKAYSPWQRPTNENTNGLLREFFPKKSDFSKITDQAVQQVEDLLNNRPRKTLGFRTPNELENLALGT